MNPGNGMNTKPCTPHIPQKNSWRQENLTMGKCMAIHPLPIIYSVDNKNKPNSYMFTPHGLLFSKSIMNIIMETCKNIQIFPAHLYYHGNEKIFDEYYTIVFPTYAAFNENQSLFTWSDIVPEKIESLSKLVISKDKLAAISPKDNIFHLKEKRVILLATETAKTAIEAVTKDVAFIEVEVAE
ncbi:hypothetical protein FACS1894130_12760 [Spirochaetia bacterium]|nr:hypothetical protein FACS1894130_12760 [Spirochaetia bacterium]